MNKKSTITSSRLITSGVIGVIASVKNTNRREREKERERGWEGESEKKREGGESRERETEVAFTNFNSNLLPKSLASEVLGTFYCQVR